MKRHPGRDFIPGLGMGYRYDMKKTLTYGPYGTSITSGVLFCDTISDVVLSQYVNKFHSALFIFDTNLREQHVQNVIAVFRKSIGKITHLGLPYGPKSLGSLERLWKQMVRSTPDLVVGMGGGVTTDLVGFASSTYQRGIPHILVPTTVLSMIDASLGGKTGIDFAGVKNSIGAVHYPIAVINIVSMLETLPKREFFSGFSEAVKAAVLFDRDFFWELEQYANKGDFSSDNPKLFAIISHSASLKMKNSEMSKQHKIKLLYGHAVGHALEILSEGKLTHGEAVSIGMNIEGEMACELGIWNKKQLLEQKELLKLFHLPTEFSSKININILIDKMSLYKKLVKGNNLLFILPKNIGEIANEKNKWYKTIPKKTVKYILKRIICVE